MQGIADYLISLGLSSSLAWLIVYVVLAGIVAVAAPASLIVLTWLERKIIGRIQNRLGPNRAGPFGWFQAVADMVKMFTKEDVTPANADRLAYNLAPGLIMAAAILSFAVIPFAPGFVGADLNVAVLYIVAIGAFGILGVLTAGWASNNKYALLGAFRAVAMLLTYEIPMVLALIIVTLAAGSMSMVKIVEAQSGMWYVVSLPLVFLIFLLAGIAEVGRSPFDLIEAESELVAGFHTEYSGMKFGLLMIGEYVHMLALSFFLSVLFLGGWQVPLVNVAALPAPFGPLLGFIVLLVKVFFFIFVMMWFRGTLPRFRIDHLLDFGWKFLTPLSLALLIGAAVAVKLTSNPWGQVVTLLIANLIVAGLSVVLVAGLARRSQHKGLQAVARVTK